MLNFTLFSFQTPVIVDPDIVNRFDLMGANERCHESEVSEILLYIGSYLQGDRLQLFFPWTTSSSLCYKYCFC